MKSIAGPQILGDDSRSLPQKFGQNTPWHEASCRILALWRPIWKNPMVSSAFSQWPTQTVATNGSKQALDCVPTNYDTANNLVKSRFHFVTLVCLCGCLFSSVQDPLRLQGRNCRSLPEELGWNVLHCTRLAGKSLQCVVCCVIELTAS